MNKVDKKVLVLAPHTDDGEFGCGGTIAKLIEQGADVYYAAFSACEQSVLPEFPVDILTTEVKAATKVLGIKPENLILFNYQVRNFNYRRQDILEDIVQLRKDIAPEIVFMPSSHDIHQDHFTIHQEGLRAFKHCNLYCYEVPWNNQTFNTNCFSILDEKHLQKKVAALAEYKSQAHRTYSNDAFIRSLATVRGVQIGKPLAEAFEVLRSLI